MGSKINFTDNQIKHIVDFYNENKTITPLEKIYNCSRIPLKRILIENGVKVTWGVGLDEEEILNLYKKLGSAREVGKYIGMSRNPILRILKINNIKPIRHSNIRRKNDSKRFKILWANKEYREKTIHNILKASSLRPTSYEEKISVLCIRNNLPFIYVGNGTFLVNGSSPDFVCKERKIAIEVFNSYHKIRYYGSIENYIKVRSKIFSEAGYKTIFIKQDEVTHKNWEEICLNKIVMGMK